MHRRSVIRGAAALIASITVLAAATPGVQAGGRQRPQVRKARKHQGRLEGGGAKRDSQYRRRNESRGAYQAFSAGSYWNRPLPEDAPVDPNSQAIIDFLKADNDYDYIRFAGTTPEGTWGQPIYWASPDDPVYNVTSTRYTLPPEFASLRIPRGAKSDVSSDAAMVVYDLQSGYVAWLWQAVYSASDDRWTAGGGAISYLDSNGLDRKWKQFEDTDPRNRGHRGVPAPIGAVRYDEVRASGAINHVLKISVDTTKNQYVFPMVGHENGTTAQFAPPEGTRLRIKPSVDLKSLNLSRSALVVAKALQTYGAVIGDQSGANATLKVENTIVEGRGYLWKGVLASDSLRSIPFDHFEVIRLGYGS